MAALSHRSYILGLDIGVASVGWCCVECDPDDGLKPVGFLREGERALLGAHLFEAGTEGSQADMERGKDEPRNVQRRTARLMRRQIWRRARRKRKLLRLLIHHGFLPSPEAIGLDRQSHLKRPIEIDGYMKALDARLATTWLEGKGHIDHQRMPYLMRASAAAGPIERHAFGRAIYHLAQRRGFLSNRRADARKKDDDDASTVKAAIGDLAGKIEAFGAGGGVPTLGGYLATLDPDEQRLRGRWTSRKMYWDEFALMWEKQALDSALNEAARKEIWDAIFWQRPLKDQSDLIGRCSLMPEEKRSPKAHRLYQRFRVLQTINNLQIAAPGAGPRKPTDQERAVLLAALLAEGDLTFARARKLIDLKKEVKFNLEAGDETKIAGHRTDGKLRAVFGERFDSFSEIEKDRMVEDLRSFRLPEALERRGVKRWGLHPDAAARFAAIALEEGYAPISLSAASSLLPLLDEGVPYATARKDRFPESCRSSQPVDSLPPVIDSMEELRNPAVLRALTEVRKLVNELTRRHGKAAVVRVELARDIKNPRGVRERISKNMREREKERAAIVERIIKATSIGRPSREDIERVLLADECGWVCPYTSKPIGWDTLLGKHPQFDIDHIWPRSRSLDDSMRNSTLGYHEPNLMRKRGHTPREAYGGNPGRFEEIMARLRLFKCDPFTKTEKIARFEAEEVPTDFTNRHLSDTRYIARATADYLALLYGGRVEFSAKGQSGRVDVCTGGLTAWLRFGWGVSGLLGENGEKNRADHRHHAVDAAIVALSDSRAVRILSQAATEADRLGKRRAFESIDEPWRGFREELDEAIKRVVVSHRQSRKVAGPLHDQTLYSKIHGETHRVRKELHKLTPAEIRDEKIVDRRAREAIRAKLKEKGKPEPTPRDIAQIFSDPGNAPLLEGHGGKKVRLRKVRVDAGPGASLIGGGSGARFIQTGNNHHTIIFAELDSAGKDRAWSDEPVTLLDCYQRRARKESIVRRERTDGSRFLFSLAPGEFVEIDSPDGSGQRAIYRVASISKGDMELKLHRDARTADELKKARARLRRSAEGLRKLKARKVMVTYLGDIRNAGG